MHRDRSGAGSFTSYAYHSATFIGINVSVEAGANNPLSAVQKGATYLNAADKTKDPQAKLLYEAAAGVQAAQGALNVYKAMDAPGGLTGAMTSFSIKIGVGVSVSTQESGATVQQASGGYILAAGNLGLYATVGDLTLKGANVSAYNVTLSAQRDLVMQSLALTDTSYSKSSSYSAFAGLAANASYGAEGMSVSYGINVSASDATSQSQTMAVNHAQTTVSGTGFVTLASGRDTNLYGAEVSGGGIAAQVARNLNIVSDQDTETQSAAQTSWSFSATLGLYGSPSSLSASYAKGDAYGNYASVTTTSGLFAGSTGYAVTVGGTTTLTAAALASAADASKNSLSTGALVTQNLTNSMSWKASYWGFSFSVSTAGPGGVQPGLSQKQTGSSSGLAQATIAPGTVTILNAALQKSLTGKTPDQVIAALNRSATGQNKAANTLPGGLAQTLQNQADRSNALMAASSSTAKLVGDAASMLYTSAAKTYAALMANRQDGDQAAVDTAKAQMDLWAEGGAGRALLQGATQGVLAWLGGGYSLTAGLEGAGGAMIASGLGIRVANYAQQLLNEAGLGDPSQITPGPLASLIAELTVTGFASSLGNMAALTAASVDMNNRQLHPLEIGEIKSLTKEFAQQIFHLGTADPTQEQLDDAEGRLMAQALRNVDDTFAKGNAQWDQEAYSELAKYAFQFVDGDTLHIMFFANAAEKQDPTIYADTRFTNGRDYDLANGMRAVYVNTDTGPQVYHIPARTQDQQDADLKALFWDTAGSGVSKGIGNLPTDVAQGTIFGPYGPQLPKTFPYDNPEEAQFGSLPMTALTTAPWVLGGLRIAGDGGSLAVGAGDQGGAPLQLPDLTTKPLLLEGPQPQGVGAVTIYGDTAGNLFVGKLPPEAGTQPIAMPPVTAEQLTAFRNVEIVDSSGKPVGELDRVIFDPATQNNNVMIEDKSATGLQNPLNIQTDAQRAQKQIYDKTVVRVDAIENIGVSTRPTPDGLGTPVVPTLSDLQTIKNYQFNINYDNPAFQLEVNKQVQALNAMFSNWSFSAKFGK